ncbi:terminase [Janibacter anophelis]|uniref:terminase n=1 Tax=Janibacter anophelis TaxID=319054 RepID=UPI003F803F28
MSKPTIPKAPSGLGARGTRFWRSTLAEFDLSDAEREILAEACRTLDDLDRLAGMVAEHGSMVTGSQGQPVLNPALTEARGQRLALHRLVAALQLPDADDAPIPTAVQMRGKRANQARWRGHTKGA